MRLGCEDDCRRARVIEGEEEEETRRCREEKSKYGGQRVRVLDEQEGCCCKGGSIRCSSAAGDAGQSVTLRGSEVVGQLRGACPRDQAVQTADATAAAAVVKTDLRGDADFDKGIGCH